MYNMALMRLDGLQSAEPAASALCGSCADSAFLLYLAGTLLGEGYAEHAKVVAICGLDLDMCLNQCLPLADQTAKLVCGEVHALHVPHCSCPSTIRPVGRLACYMSWQHGKRT